VNGISDSQTIGVPVNDARVFLAFTEPGCMDRQKVLIIGKKNPTFRSR